ncbi:MAG: ECF transporter S component [Faecalibacterium prausnitzii]|nr:ECF transporter S component [Faecalibacterium prausnitzii]
MKTRTPSPARKLVLAALFLALAFVLPLLTGQVPQVGSMLCPMHFPVLLCGFVLGGPWGVAVGFAAPLLRSVFFGMPPMYPVAIAMAFELAAYGGVSGWLYRKVKHTLPTMYAVLLTAMVAGRLVWGAVRFVLAGLSGSSFPFSAFLSGALFTAVPGILAQLVLIPLILTALQKAKLTN